MRRIVQTKTLTRKDTAMELKSNFNPLTATAAHENTILASPVLPEGMPAPFDHAWGYLDKPGEMERHRHPKEEVYFFLKGTGFVFVDGEEIPVQPGDVVRIPADALHTVINRRNEELLWAASSPNRTRMVEGPTIPSAFIPRFCWNFFIFCYIIRYYFQLNNCFLCLIFIKISF